MKYFENSSVTKQTWIIIVISLYNNNDCAEKKYSIWRKEADFEVWLCFVAVVGLSALVPSVRQMLAPTV